MCPQRIANSVGTSQSHLYRTRHTLTAHPSASAARPFASAVSSHAAAAAAPRTRRWRTPSGKSGASRWDSTSTCQRLPRRSSAGPDRRIRLVAPRRSRPWTRRRRQVSRSDPAPRSSSSPWRSHAALAAATAAGECGHTACMSGRTRSACTPRSWCTRPAEPTSRT